MRMTTKSSTGIRSVIPDLAGAGIGKAALFAALLACAQLRTSDVAAGTAPESMRQRVSFNAGWKFQKGDPPGTDGQLAYRQIKNWITATGNEFALGPDRVNGVRPEGNLGGNIAFAQRAYDDREWRQLNLPHDWGIEGPFKQEYPGETGKLPWWGVGWYRKHFTPSAADKSKQFNLDIDGALA